jgi:hypothetical protein
VPLNNPAAINAICTVCNTLNMLNILNGLAHLSIWIKQLIIFREIFKIWTDRIADSADHNQVGQRCSAPRTWVESVVASGLRITLFSVPLAHYYMWLIVVIYINNNCWQKSFNPFPSVVMEILAYRQKLSHRDVDANKWVTALA